MNKAIKKYGRAKWIETRLSRKHKARMFHRKLKAYITASQGLTILEQIKSTPMPKLEKSLAISKAMLDTQKAIIRALKGE